MEVHNHQMVEARSDRREYIKFVAVIIGILLLSTVIFSYTTSGGAMEWMRLFMGVFFVVFASFKFAGYKMFALMFTGYDIIAKRFKTYAYAYPFIELFLGAAYLFDLTPGLRDWLTLVIMSVGAIGVAGEIKRRSGVHCACLGNVIRLPLKYVSLVEDAGMGLMALAMIVGRF